MTQSVLLGYLIDIFADIGTCTKPGTNSSNSDQHQFRSTSAYFYATGTLYDQDQAYCLILCVITRHLMKTESYYCHTILKDRIKKMHMTYHFMKP